MQHICLIQSVLIKQNICIKKIIIRLNSIQDYDQQSIFAHIYLNVHTFIEIIREQNTQEDLGLKLHLDFHFYRPTTFGLKLNLNCINWA